MRARRAPPVSQLQEIPLNVQHHASSRAQLRQYHFAHMHPSITADRIFEAVEREFTTLDNPGFCLHCGAEADGCEPDARQYQCESCGEAAVYGAAEILIAIA